MKITHALTDETTRELHGWHMVVEDMRDDHRRAAKLVGLGLAAVALSILFAAIWIGERHASNVR